MVLRDLVVVDDLDALGRELRRGCSRQIAGVVGDELADAAPDLRSSCSVGVMAVGDAARAPACACASQARDADLEELVEVATAKIARNFTRSSSGLRASPASWRTRALNSSQDSSRLRIGPRCSRCERRRGLPAARGPGCGSDGGHGPQRLPGIR